MNIRILSDLHLEFGMLELPVLPGEENDVLVLAGDVGIAKKEDTFKPFLEVMSQRFQHVFYIMGNHEHYHGSIIRSVPKIKEACDHLKNLHVVERGVMRVNDVSFIGATLWASYSRANPLIFEKARYWMNDHRLIRTGPLRMPYQKRFRPEDAYYTFLDTMNWIFPTIEEEKATGRKVVVVTHHAPSLQSIAPQFRNHELNGAYASSLDDDIIKSKPEVWIHGHTHSSFAYQVGQTAVICNPRGYVGVEENPDFNPKLRINL